MAEASVCAADESSLLDIADFRLTALGYEAGQRILALLLLRNAQAANMKVGQ